MADQLPDGFKLDGELPDGFVLDDQSHNNQQDMSTWETIKDMFTGESRRTAKINSLEEIGGAPELNEMTMPSFMTSLGLLSTTNPLEAQKIIKSQFGDKAGFSQDSKGNVIVSLPSGDYALNSPGLSFQDVVSGIYNAAAFGKAGLTGGIFKAGAQNAGVEAALETSEYLAGGDAPDIGEISIAGGLGSGFKGAENVFSGLFRYGKGKSDNSLVEQAADEGVPVMTSDAVPSQTFAGRMATQTGEKIPVVGTGGMRQAQQETREVAVDRLAQDYDTFSYNEIVESLKNKKDKIKSAAGNVLEATGRKLDGVGYVEPTNTLKAIQLVKDELSKPGVIKNDDAIARLNGLIEALESPQTFTTLKENRTAFRDIIDGFDSAERSQLGSRAQSLLRNVTHALKKDMNDVAKKNLTTKEFHQWNKANNVYAQEAIKLKKTKIKSILDKGDITPEQVRGMIFSKNKSEMELLYKSLDNSGRANVRSAIISQIFENLSKRTSKVSPNSVATELKKMMPQISVFFKGQERVRLKGLERVLNATRRAQDAAVTTPTGQTLIGGLTGYGAFTDLGATAGTLLTLGGLSRFYESPVVRDALLKLGSVQPGSTQFEKVLRESMNALNASAQSLKNQLQEDKPQSQ